MLSEHTSQLKTVLMYPDLSRYWVICQEATQTNAPHSKGCCREDRTKIDLEGQVNFWSTFGACYTDLQKESIRT